MRRFEKRYEFIFSNKTHKGWIVFDDENQEERELLFAKLENTFKYNVFCDLYTKGFYVTNGIKFGADFLVYKSDPLICHSEYMVFIKSCQSVSQEDLILMERISNNAKKHAVIAYSDKIESKYSNLSELKIQYLKILIFSDLKIG